MKNTHNLTPAQIKRNRLFVTALRMNKKKARNTMRNDKGGRCCLCVAYDVAQANGAKLPKLPDGSSFPPPHIGNWYGWDSYDPVLGRMGRTASEYNDGSDNAAISHRKIAALFESKYLK